ncbi:MAG: hypothetical protein KIT83_18360 [Bryobacterales bacterium]|nr:hypothetical protein [Bryobacterales bacterium]
MKRTLAILLILAGFGTALVRADGWQSERNFYKRVEKGLEVAEQQFDEARKIYRQGDPYEAQAQLEVALDTAMEAYQMIVDSGEDMRRRASRFKKIEIQMRGFLRKLEDYNAQVDLLDRGPVHRTWQTVSLMQDNLLKSMFQGGPLPPVEKVK